MLKTRIMPTLLYRNFNLVKGRRFDSWRTIGNVIQAVKVYNMREVDELVFLDIAATREGRRPDFELVDDFADECFMPLAVGGGIRTLDDVQRLLMVGADKVVVNTAAVESPGLIEDIARGFGSQCVVVSIDARATPAGYQVCVRSGTRPAPFSPAELARQAQERGAGEILLTSMDQDGTMEGYDIELIRSVAHAVSIPVIASGGAGDFDHLLQAVRRGGASAVAAAAMFHFTEKTPLEAKRYLADRGVPVRLQPRQTSKLGTP